MHTDTSTAPVVTLVTPCTVVVYKHPHLRAWALWEGLTPYNKVTYTYTSLLTPMHGLANSPFLLVCQDPCRCVCLWVLHSHSFLTAIWAATEGIAKNVKFQNYSVLHCLARMNCTYFPLSFISCVSLHWEGASENKLCSKHLSSVMDRWEVQCFDFTLISTWVSLLLLCDCSGRVW